MLRTDIEGGVGLPLIQELQDAEDAYLRNANCGICGNEKQAPQPKLTAKEISRRRRRRIVEKKAEKKRFTEKGNFEYIDNDHMGSEKALKSTMLMKITDTFINQIGTKPALSPPQSYN
uniref:Uncharacterized protein n=1 Tax=Glossina pallidipes TaxID=7398 RepID=A0A1B0AIY7_GLOPL